MVWFSSPIDSEASCSWLSSKRDSPACDEIRIIEDLINEFIGVCYGALILIVWKIFSYFKMNESVCIQIISLVIFDSIIGIL